MLFFLYIFTTFKVCLCIHNMYHVFTIQVSLCIHVVYHVLHVFSVYGYKCCHYVIIIVVMKLDEGASIQLYVLIDT